MRKTIRLELNFITSEGKARTLGLSDPKLDLDEETVRSAMERIADQDVFEKDGTKLYQAVAGARYVTRTLEDIFD